MITNTEVSNLSYTNKDFNSIYSELLEYAKKLSYKWDPTASDESDPGVVLLKLAALIGDKDNYNIDKNTLELMPASVTQLAAARQLFDQCGYSMKYYQSASGYINLTIKEDLGEDLVENQSYIYTIPRFTMFCDEDSAIVYTTIKEETIDIKTEVAIPVIEGTITSYTVNNDALITPQHLDSDNRIYFTESNVAENGVFVKNVSNRSNIIDRDLEATWICVDNLQTQEKGTPCFKFGVTLDGSACYIEFPDDAEFLIGEGINIDYILSSGATGNIAANKLKQLFVDTKFKRAPKENANLKEDVTVTSENIYVRNVLPTGGGADPESIDQAYKNYKRVRDTFKTLVSLKDYSDFIVTAKTASNGYVCDRTNDVQYSHKVITTTDESTYVTTKVAKSDLLYKLTNMGAFEQVGYEDKMNAFDLCVYALEYVPTVSDTPSFKRSFSIVNVNDTQNAVIDALNSDESYKSLQHNFLKFEEDTILMIKNKYPVYANIVPRAPLSTTEKLQVISNIEAALYSNLNSKELTFGRDLNPVSIQQIILNADERIKTLIDFVSPVYETYAVYKSGDEFKELRIDDDSLDGGYQVKHVTRASFNQLWSSLHVYKKGEFVAVTDQDTFDSEETYYTYDSDLSALWNKFRVDIFTKNVLSGVTPLYDDVNVYAQGINQTALKEYTDIVKIASNSEINLTFDEDTEKFSSPVIRANESILLTAPNFVEENTYSSYVRILYSIKEDLSSDDVYELSNDLSNDDFIIFFYKESDSSVDYQYIKYSAGNDSPAKFISPAGFTMKKEQDLSSTVSTQKVNSKNVLDYFRTLPDGKGKTSSTKNPTNPFVEGKNYSETEFVKECLKNSTNNQVLTGAKIVKTLKINKFIVNNDKDGCSSFYWFLNQQTTDGKYTLFKAGESPSYTLQSGEYFIYTNDSKSVLYQLGQGTLIELTGTEWLDASTGKVANGNDVSVIAIAYDELFNKGMDALEGKWYTLRKVASGNTTDKGIQITEQQMLMLGPDNTLIAVSSSSATGQINQITLNSTEPRSLANYKLSYKDSSGNVFDIPTITSNNGGWSGSTILNIDLSSTSVQELKSGQSIAVTDANNKVSTIPDENDSEPASVFLRSNKDLHAAGSQNIDVGPLYPKDSFSILSYKQLYDEGDTPKETVNSAAVDITLTKENDRYKGNLTFELLSGNYLLQLVPYSTLQGLVVKVNETELHSIGNAYVYKINVEASSEQSMDGTEVTLEIEATLDESSNDNEVTIFVPPLFKYGTKTLSSIEFVDDSSTFETSVLERIKQLDFDTEYSYTYRPVNGIKNPLVSNTFFNRKHFYNAYTIPEWDTYIDDNITVHDVVR